MTNNLLGKLSLKGYTSRQTVVLAIVVALTVLSALLIPAAAQAHGSACLGGRGYRDSGTSHNYVYFEIPPMLRSRTDWHVHYPWWAFPIDLWNGDASSGILKAGIRYTDYDPSYGAWNYKVCVP